MKDIYPNLNSRDVKRAVVAILDKLIGYSLQPYEIRDKDIWYSREQYRLYVRGVSILYYDRQMHYPRKIMHTWAIYEYLNSVREVVGHNERHYMKKIRATFQDED